MTEGPSGSGRSAPPPRRRRAATPPSRRQAAMSSSRRQAAMSSSRRQAAMSSSRRQAAMPPSRRGEPTHPRMSARRAAVRRAAGRRRLRALVGALGVFSAVGVGWLALQSSLFDVDHVLIDGARHLSPEEVAHAAGVPRGEALLLLDRGAVSRRVERLPWVRDARTSVRLPGTLRISIDERVPVVWVARPRGGVVVVDAGGRVLAVRPVPLPGVIELRHKGAVPPPGRRLRGEAGALRIADAVPDGLAGRVSTIVSERGGYVLTLATVERVRFGSATRIGEKWGALEAILARLGDTRVYQIDVRVPTAAAVAPTPPTTTPPTTTPPTTTSPTATSPTAMSPAGTSSKPPT